MAGVREAVRGLLRTPGTTVISVLVLAAALGVTVAAFSLINALWFSELPLREPSRLRFVRYGSVDRPLPVSRDAYDAMASALRPLGYEVCGVGVDEGVITGRSARVRGELLTAECATTLGLPLGLGRGLERGAQGILISHALWQSVLGGTPDAVGRPITLDGAAYTVAGVTSPRFISVLSRWEASSYWILLEDRAHHLSEAWSTGWAAMPLLVGVVRVPAGGSEADLTGRLAALQTSSAQNGSGAQRSHVIARSLPVRLPFEVGQGQAPRVAASLLLLGGIVLSIACVNLAGVLMGRALASRADLAVRRALGEPASRAGVRALSEILIITLAAGLVAVALSRVFLTWGFNQIPSLPIGDRLSVVLLDTQIDWRVLAFSSGVTLTAAILVWLTASTRTTYSIRLDLEGTSLTSRTAHRLHTWLIVPQIALTIALVALALAFIEDVVRTEAELQRLGARKLLVMSFDLPPPARSQQTPALMAAFAQSRASMNRRLLAALREDPAFASAALSDAMPFANGRTWVSSNGGTPRAVSRVAVTQGFFHAAGLPLLAGRDFTEAEVFPPSPVGHDNGVIISESLAALVSPGENPVGRIVTLHDPDGRIAGDVTVLGVAGDWLLPNGGVRPTVYLPMRPPRYALHALARTTLDSDPADAARIAGLARRIEPAVVVRRSDTAEQVVGELVFPRRFAAVILGGAAALGIALSAFCLYGAVTFAAVHRTREIGIRAALGAGRPQMAAVVMRDGLVAVFAGTTIGWALALAAHRVGEAWFGETAWNPWVLGVVSIFIATLVSAACARIAWRASGTSPLIAMRAT
ncbi:MAG: ABC transporter permease [Acidobacteriota bacterium]|nr:ABC transporter permease [Acidobacteriota bacterium]